MDFSGIPMKLSYLDQKLDYERVSLLYRDCFNIGRIAAHAKKYLRKIGSTHENYPRRLVPQISKIEDSISHDLVQETHGNLLEQ